MPGINDYLDQYALPDFNTEKAPAPAPSSGPILSTQDAVDAAASRDAAGEGRVNNELLRDIRTLSNTEIMQKYGVVQGAEIIGQASRGEQDYRTAANAERSGGQIVTDGALSLGSAYSGLVGGILSTALGTVSDTAGTRLAEETVGLQNDIRSLQSPGLQDRREATAARSRVSAVDSAIQYALDVDKVGETRADMRRVGRDILYAGENTLQDGAITGDVVAEGAGSLLAGGPIIKGVSVAGKGALSLLQRGGLSSRAAGVGARAVKYGSAPVGIGIMEGSGAYSQTVNEVMGMDLSTLNSQSEDFRKLVADGMDPKEAQRKLANAAGIEAALITAPVAAGIGAGTFVGKFASNPLAVGGGFGKGVGNIAKETLEESLQGGVSQLATNKALDSVDPARSISEDVGEQIAMGAIGGFGAAGITSTPNILSGTARQSTKAAKRAYEKVEPTVENLIQSQARVEKENEEASPTSDKAVQEMLVGSFETLVTERKNITEEVSALPSNEAAETVVDTISNLTDTVVFSPDQLNPNITTPVVQEALGETEISRVDAMARLEEVINTSEEGSVDQISAALLLRQMGRDVTDIADNPQTDIIEDLDPESAIYRTAVSMTGALKGLLSNTTFRSSLAASDKVISTAAEKDISDPTSEQGNQNVQAVVTQAETNPGSGDLDSVNTTLEHAESGRVALSDTQIKALRASSALLQAERDRLEINEKNGINARDMVSSEILTEKQSGEDAEPKSLAQYTQDIQSAYRAGDNNRAAAQLQKLMFFAQHMRNKVEALNEHYSAGGGDESTGVYFDALLKKGVGKFQESVQPLYIQPTSETSISLAQQIDREATTVQDMANTLSEIFPELGIPAQPTVKLDSGLEGTPKEIALREKVAKRSTNAKAANEKKAQRKAEEVSTELQEARDKIKELEAQLDESASPKETETDAKPEEQTEELADLEPAGKPDEPTQEAEATPESTPEADVVEEVSEPVADVVEETQEEVTEEVAEEAPTEEDVFQPADEPAEPDQSLTSTLYPNLVGSEENPNRLHTSFSVPVDSTTTILGDPSPISTVLGVITGGVIGNIGGKTTELSPAAQEAYTELLKKVEELSSRLEVRLDGLLSHTTKGSKTTNLDRFLKDGKLGKYPRGKVLHITEPTLGGLEYNKPLIESALLGSLQWLNDIMHYQSTRDFERLAGILNVTETDMYAALGGNSGTILTGFQQGLTSVEAGQSLAGVIRRYWGLKPNPQEGDGYVEGIPEAVAKEIISAMVDIKMISRTRPISMTLELKEGFSPIKAKGKQQKDGDRGVDPVVFSPLAYEEGKNPLEALKEVPDAIEKIVQVKPEPKTFVGTPPEDVAKKQHNNRRVDNTVEQIAAIRNRQNTPFFLNEGMVSFFSQVGREGILKLFGTPNLEEDQTNVSHFKTLSGRNKSWLAQFDTMLGTLSELEAVSTVSGEARSDVPAYFRYNFTRTNRQQMLGVNTPQSSKLMREVQMPKASNLDARIGSDGHLGLLLAVAQHIGVSIENSSPREVAKDIHGRLNSTEAGGLKSSLDALNEWAQEKGSVTDDLIDTLRSDLGNDLNPAAIHSLLEYARWRETSEEGRKNFSTQLYIEADGKTNGPINAMMLFTVGAFTEQFLSGVSKGGFSLGETRPLHVGNTGDLYESTSLTLQSVLGSFIADLPSEPQTQSKHLLWLMDRFLGKDLSVTRNESSNQLEISVGRGLSKNPLTVTLYGSGAKGIAGKLTKSVMDSISERMTEAMSRMAENDQLSVAEAMFPDHADPDVQLKVFQEALYNLMLQKAHKTRRGWKMTGMPEVDRSPFTREILKNFEPKKGAYLTFTENMNNLVVTSLRDSIQSTVGEGLTETLKDVRQATQVQSILLGAIFDDAVANLIEEKKALGEWEQGDTLSKVDVDNIFKSLEKLSPILKTGKQNFLFGTRTTSDLESEENEFSANTQGNFRTKGFTEGFGDAGVSGIPGLVMGSGDGTMMQVISSRFREMAQRTLDVFDGINVPLDNYNEYSQKANEAVWESWNRNPLDALAKQLNTFIENMPDIELSDKNQTLLAKALFDMWPSRPGDNIAIGKTELAGGLSRLSARINEKALDVQARQNALQRVNLSVDQMAGTASPFEVADKISLAGMDANQKLALLNSIYAEERAKLLSEAKVEKPVVPPEAEALGLETNSGARVINAKSVGKLGSMLGNSRAQGNLLSKLTSRLAAKEYRIVVGSRSEVSAWLQAEGVDPSVINKTGKKVNGITRPDLRLIALVNPTSETLTHEVIHATTFENVASYYNGKNKGNNSVAAAIRAIEALAEQFEQLNEIDMSLGEQEAYANTINAMEAAGDNKAIRLNEFMAWGLSNPELRSKLTNTEATPLGKLVRSLVQKIKQLVFGPRASSAVANDMLSNLQFNTQVVAATKVDIGQEFAQTTLFQEHTYGRDPRLVQLNKFFHGAIGKVLATQFKDLDPKESNTIIEQKIFQERKENDRLVNLAGKAFAMNGQQKSTLELVLMAMRAENSLDGSSLVKAGELFSHFLRTTDVKSFMVEPNNPSTRDRIQAQNKMELLRGGRGLEFDEEGRSTLLPLFLGLSMVSPEMQRILKNIPLPPSVKNRDGTTDAYLTNLGNGLIEKLGDRFSGQTGDEVNIQEAMASLTDQMIRVTEERKGMISIMTNVLGNTIDKANDGAVSLIAKASEYTNDRSTEVIESTDNKYVKTAAKAARVVAGMANKDLGNALAEEAMAELNSSPKVPEFLFTLINDIVGRTENNAPIYDLIKRVRNWVQQRRQQFRERLPQLLAKQFSRELSDTEWAALYRGWGKTDVAALFTRYTKNEVMTMLRQPANLAAEKAKLEGELLAMQPNDATLLMDKAQQLATYMNTRVIVGSNLLKNAGAISELLEENSRSKKYAPAAGQVDLIDQLTSIYALEGMDRETKEIVSDIVQNEDQGTVFALSYLEGLRNEELNKRTGRARYNALKGYIPQEAAAKGQVVVRDDSEFNDLSLKSYERVGDYTGSNLDRYSGQRGYYYSPVNARAVYQQGIMQTAQQTSGGVDIVSGLTHGPDMAGTIHDSTEVERIRRSMGRERATEPLVAVFDASGDVVAYQRSVDPEQLLPLEFEEHLGNAIGIWRGRQVEEAEGQQVNKTLINRMKDMYDEDIQKSGLNQSQYIDVFSPDEQAANPVLRDTMTSIPGQAIQDISQVFGDQFWVRRDMLNDSLGYRDASVRNLWDGNSNINPKIMRAAQKILISTFGNRAFKYYVNGEEALKNVITDLRVIVVVKSVIVPAANLTWNVLQLATRGVPIGTVTKSFPRKVVEIDTYLKTRERLIDVEAEIAAAGKNLLKVRKLEAEIQEITDVHKKLTIWPLIEAGELTSISDGMLAGEDMKLMDGKLSEYFEKAVDKLPENSRNLARYGFVSRDTALFKGLQRAIEYGDFLGKAVLYDDLVGRQGKSKEEALATVTEEFVNYDRLPGRTRGYLEQVGLLWFWNFKIRSTKVALNMLRNNPVHAFMVMNLPFPDIFGPVGSPLTDNAVEVISDGRAGYSVGPGMALNAPALNPWWNLFN